MKIAEDGPHPPVCAYCLHAGFQVSAEVQESVVLLELPKEMLDAHGPRSSCNLIILSFQRVHRNCVVCRNDVAGVHESLVSVQVELKHKSKLQIGNDRIESDCCHHVLVVAAPCKRAEGKIGNLVWTRNKQMSIRMPALVTAVESCLYSGVLHEAQVC